MRENSIQLLFQAQRLIHTQSILLESTGDQSDGMFAWFFRPRVHV
jgi:hypothetical protein